MDKTLLVGFDVQSGLNVLKALDKAEIEANVALLLSQSDTSDWRLVLASESLDQDSPRRAYDAVNDALRSEGIRFEDKPPILILNMNDPFIKTLRKMFAKNGHVLGMRRKNGGVIGMRISGQLIGDRFVDDAYVYRIK